MNSSCELTRYGQADNGLIELPTTSKIHKSYDYIEPAWI